MNNILTWIEQWYSSQCDGEWEHEYSIKIYTLDNPGWGVTIDLMYTELEKVEIPYELLEKSEDDWLGYSVKNAIFKASGDPQKLELLLIKFKEIAENINK